MPKRQIVLARDRPTRESTLVKRLEESLRKKFPSISFDRMTIDKSLKVLKEAYQTDKTLREVLLSDAAGATAKMLATVWDAALPKLVGRQCVQVITGTTPSIRVPRAAKAKAYKIGEIGVPPIVAESYDYVEITARKWAAFPVVSRDLVEDAQWDVIERQYREAARAIAEAETEEILTTMISDAGNTISAGTSGSLALSDIAGAITEIAKDDFEADTIVVNPQEYGDLLKDTAISYYMYFGGNVAQTGNIPQLLGCKLLVSSKCTAGTALVLDSKNAGVLYVRRDVTIEDYEDPVKDLVGAVVTARFRYATIRANAICTVTSA